MRRVALLLALLLPGCSTEEGEEGPYIQASIDGVMWRGAAQEGEVSFIVGEGGYVWVLSTKEHRGTSQYLVLDLPYPPGVGSWSLGGDSATASFASCPDDVLADCIWWEPVGGDPGILEITSIDPNTGRITGTFGFTGYALGDSTGTTKSFAEGTFDILAPGVFVLE